MKERLSGPIYHPDFGVNTHVFTPDFEEAQFPKNNSNQETVKKDVKFYHEKNDFFRSKEKNRSYVLCFETGDCRITIQTSNKNAIIGRLCLTGRGNGGHAVGKRLYGG